MTRFSFGTNWADYLNQITEEHFAQALKSFKDFSGITTLQGLTFLDVGGGSGIHSWVALQLGASHIVSFDRDALSTETCRRLKTGYARDAEQWRILKGDALDTAFLAQLGTFDYVLAWGVLHHTGRMWTAIENVARVVSKRGRLHLAIYNRHWTSPFWKVIKWAYCRAPVVVQKGWLAAYVAWEDLKQPLRHGRRRPDDVRERGMSRRNDLADWLGGYPYEYASPEEVQAVLGKLGFRCLKALPNRGTGCSEFLFERTAS